jgi:hypothetical protein
VFCPNAPVWGDVATWVTGLATVATLFFGIFQWFRLRAQSIAERAAKAEEERRAQARTVYAYLADTRSGPARALLVPPAVRVGNMSNEPVYAVVVHLVYMDGDKPGSGEETERNIRQILRTLSSVAPGVAEAAARPVPTQLRAVIQTLPHGNYELDLQVQQDYPGVEISFTDAAGRYWVRRVTGELTEREADALDHYGIDIPVDYAQLIGRHRPVLRPGTIRVLLSCRQTCRQVRLSSSLSGGFQRSS